MRLNLGRNHLRSPIRHERREPPYYATRPGAVPARHRPKREHPERQRPRSALARRLAELLDVDASREAIAATAPERVLQAQACGWPQYDPVRRASMRFDLTSKVDNNPLGPALV